MTYHLVGGAGAANPRGPPTRSDKSLKLPGPALRDCNRISDGKGEKKKSAANVAVLSLEKKNSEKNFDRTCVSCARESAGSKVNSNFQRARVSRLDYLFVSYSSPYRWLRVRVQQVPPSPRQTFRPPLQASNTITKQVHSCRESVHLLKFRFFFLCTKTF